MYCPPNSELVDVINKIADPSANLCFIGPTQVDFSMVAVRMISEYEQKQLKQWKVEDLKSYYHQLGRDKRY